MSITTFVGTPAQMMARIQELEMRLVAPGHFECPTCHFHISKDTITPERCHNCGTPMWRVTWKRLYQVERESRIRLVKHYTGQEGLT